MQKKSLILLILIVTLGLVLSITGIRWGLMTSKYFHAAAYAPDESEVIKAIGEMDPSKLDFRMKSLMATTKGTFHPYMLAAWIKTASIFGLVKLSSSFDYYKANPNELVKLYVTGRSMSVFFGALLVILLFFLAKNLYGDYKIALLSALLLAISPIHSIWTHYISTDPLLVFEVCLIFLMSLYILKEGGDSKKPYLITGILVGIAGSTKHSIVPIVIIPVLAHILGGKKLSDKRLLFYLLLTPVGYAIGNPFSVIDPKAFILAMRDSVTINITPDPKTNLLDGLGPQPQLLYYLTVAPKYNLGIPLAVLSLAGVIFAFIKREKTDILILAWIIIFWVFISFASPWQIVHWQFPYIPFLCILSARFAVYAFRYTKKYIKILAVTVFSLICLYTFFYSAAYIKMMTEKDIRDEASEWIEQNIPEGKKIAVPDVYFWNPSIVMMQYWYKETEPFYKGIKKYKISQIGWLLKNLKRENPDYVILADFEYYPILKLKSKYAHPEVLPFLEEIMQSGLYIQIKKFEKRPELFGITAIGGFFPPELRMVNPTILVYARTNKR
ncbi:MAG: phospholipid carrier-dependent glycosyltransferase [Elusimicrobia bacterium]|nr:phospholipid carrier-dependent glycosyltransferase [Elusimicrobiota bacterium]